MDQIFFRIKKKEAKLIDSLLPNQIIYDKEDEDNIIVLLKRIYIRYKAITKKVLIREYIRMVYANFENKKYISFLKNLLPKKKVLHKDKRKRKRGKTLGDDPLGHYLSGIRGSIEGKYRYSTSLHTYDLYEITKVLKESGYIKRYETDGGYITIYLKQNTTTNIIQSIRRVSKPGQNFYTNYKDLVKLSKQTNNFYGGIAIIKTKSGIKNHIQALNRKEGGIILFIII